MQYKSSHKILHILFIVFIVVNKPFFLKAQTPGTIKGILKDSLSGDVLPLATIAVFKVQDTALITYRLSNASGEFKIPGIPLNTPCRISITFSGYLAYREEFQLTNEESMHDFQSILLVRTFKTLDEVVVLSERPPVIIKKDTIEFNASSFKTLPTALVEDLLKKLPGVLVDKDGNITVNGKPVNRILVDSKDFFGGDLRMATRNLPANIIDKVQVAEDKEQLLLNPGLSSSQIGQVINLKLKKSIKKGSLGKAYAGYGTSSRFEGGAILNTFRDTLQFSLLGYTNNLNRSGFTISDLKSIGGFQRSGVRSTVLSGQGGVSLNGISFGGLDYGITRSAGTGVNVNYDVKKKLKLNAQYFYGNANNDIEQENNKEQYIKDTILNVKERAFENKLNQTHIAALGFVWNIDPKTRFDFKPRIVIKTRESVKNSASLTENNTIGKINSNNNDNSQGLDSKSYNHTLGFSKSLRKNSSFIFSNLISAGNDANEIISNVIDSFFDAGPPIINRLDQKRLYNAKNFRLSMNADFYVPLSGTIKLRLGINSDITEAKINVKTLNKDINTGNYAIPNGPLTGSIAQKNNQLKGLAGLQWNKGNVQVTANASGLILGTNVALAEKKPVRNNYFYLLPAFNIDWGNLNIGYEVYVTPPATSDLLSIPDNTNTLFLVVGNPELKNSLSHSMSASYNKYNTEKLINVYGYVTMSIQQNGVIKERTIDSKGVQVVRPVNESGLFNLYGNLGASKEYKSSKNIQFTIKGRFVVSYDKSKILINSKKTSTYNTDLNFQGGFTINWKDIIEITPSFTRHFNTSRYLINDFPGLQVTSQRFEHEFIIRWPKKIVWETTSNYYVYKERGQFGNRQMMNLWKGSLTYVFMEKNRGQLKLSVFDIFNRNSIINRYVTENYIESNQITGLKRYGLLTFYYNIGGFTNKKLGGKERLLLF